ncbi:hypothetical protein F1880_005527 [Penicillium rolfsii]|nr:hypothetical protein F1880_005527 [Penicillium rolfsii]
MSENILEGEALDDKFVARVSQVLNAAGVPNLLWGNYLLSVYGVPTITEDVAFVVADEHTAMASSALKEADFSPCRKGSSCPRSPGFQARPPAEHLHINEDFVISLYKKSDMLWKFGVFGGCQFEQSPHILSASDVRLPLAVPGRGRGRFSQEFPFVRIPSAATFCEALILLICRDYDTVYETYWLAMLTYILEYVDETEVFDEKDLGGEYRKFYAALKSGDPTTYLLLDELRSDLISKGDIPKG